MENTRDILTEPVNPTVKTAAIIGIGVAFSVVVLHFLFALAKAINDIPRGLSWGVRGPFMNLDTLLNTGTLGHLIDFLGFPRTEFGFIPNSIFHGLFFGWVYYVCNRRKNRLLRWALFKPPRQQKKTHTTEKEIDEGTFCRLRITTCCRMPLLRNAKPRIYYFDPQNRDKAILAAHLGQARCPWCGAKNWHARAWSVTATLPNSWAHSLQKYKGYVRHLASKMERDDE